jgi:hypothetical protein
MRFGVAGIAASAAYVHAGGTKAVRKSLPGQGLGLACQNEQGWGFQQA